MRRENHQLAKFLEPQYPMGREGFAPAYTPLRMLKLGVFGGAYFAKATEDDFTGLSVGLELRARKNTGVYRAYNNCFGVRAGLSYEEWNKRGWIFDEDPLGWFHWYCRYYNGRRCDRDAHQINRWLKYRERWGDRARAQRMRGGTSAVVMQGLLQWSIDPWW